MDELFYIVHLCGEKRDERAYAPLCRLIGESEEASDFLGDADASTLNGILINVCDGDPAPLMRAIESPSGDEFARGAALEALGYLARAKSVLSDDEMRAYLKRLRREMKPRGECCVLDRLGGDGRQSRLRRSASRRRDLDQGQLHRRRRIQPGRLRPTDEDGRARTPTGLSGFQGDFVGPLEGSIETLSQWAVGDEAELDEEDGEGLDDEPGFEAPYVNPLRDVGRNDPCPCGSGKKYKKCCLAE